MHVEAMVGDPYALVDHGFGAARRGRADAVHERSGGSATSASWTHRPRAHCSVTSWTSTRSSQIAIAFWPRPSASTISFRYGS